MDDRGSANIASTTPSSTYRLQFRDGMTFDRAIGLIPHLMRLGITHLYASPIFAAVAGSSHGYDVTDPNALEPEIGGMEGFLRLSSALREAGLGLILDIVPNHMAASLENAWWASVVKWGAASPYADYFDTDWSQRLTLPILTGPLEREIAEGAAKLAFDDLAGTVSFNYRGTDYPLHPGTYALAFASQAMAARLRALSPSPENEAVFHEQARRIALEHAGNLELITSPDEIAALVDHQPWKPIHWQDAAKGLSYRRFFEVTGLVGVRVDKPAVFDAAHRLVLDLVHRGLVQGLRIDHIDGLADPTAYLRRLRNAAGPELYIVVEKILEGDETLRPDWPIAGTTGYEFIADLAGVFTDHGANALDGAWSRLAPALADPLKALRQSKRLMADVNFKGEVCALARLADEISRIEGKAQLSDDGVLSEAVREFVTGFPVYRTYSDAEGLDEGDQAIIEDVVTVVAHEHRHLRDAMLFLGDIMNNRVGDAAYPDARRFRTRLQHLTGPILAKSLEDTFFYRYNRLIALNEVGGDPISREGGVDRFHAHMQRRASRHPYALTATSTHDTKRGEDARARLYTLSEEPGPWVAAVDRWRGMHEHLVAALPGDPAPEPAVEWLVYQAMAGVLPLDFDPEDQTKFEALSQRFLAYLEKALREAKLRTNWSDVNEDYENAVKAYARHLLSDKSFLDDFRRVLAPYAAAGVINSLSQTLLKLTVPGVPDIYQGCEGFDFSLVDPDNRRPPDFDRLAPPDAEPALTDPAALKSWLIGKMLALRLRHRGLFDIGAYVPLEVRGPRREHVMAFARHHDGRVAIVVVPRLVLSAVSQGTLPSVDYWGETAVVVGDIASGLSDPLREDQAVFSGTALPAALLFQHRPFSLLLSSAA